MAWHSIESLTEEACKRYIQGNLDYEIEGVSILTRFATEVRDLPAITIVCPTLTRFPEDARFSGIWTAEVVVSMYAIWSEQGTGTGATHDQRVAAVTDLFTDDDVAAQLNAAMSGENWACSDMQISGRENVVEENKIITRLTLEAIVSPSAGEA
jgi:hypothetical protein